MKKIYLSLFSVIAAGVATAQSPVLQPLKKNAFIGEVSSKTQTAPASEKINIWTNDFSTPADWTTNNSGSPAHTGGSWAITTNLTAIPVSALTPAGFTTAANGYALINSDAAGSTASQSAWITNTSNIDLSAYPNVSLSFSQSHRRYQEQTFVIVSNDGGATWTEFEVNAGMPVNTNSPNPETVQVNISSVAGGESDVRIGFKYIGSFDWFWAIDDVLIKSTDPYDLALTGFYWGSEGYRGKRLPYYKVPRTQIAPVIFGGIAKNVGALTQTDVTFNVAIASAGFSSSSAPYTLAPEESDTLDAAATFTPPATTAASYAVTGTVLSGATDVSPLNNTLPALTFEVTNDVYARDKGAISSGQYNSGLAYEVGNIFDIRQSFNLMGVQVFISSSTVPGAAAFATLYSINESGNFVSEEVTDPIEITSAMLNTWITFPFQAFPLFAGPEGSSYLVTVGSSGSAGTNNDLVIGASGTSEAQTSFYLDETDTWFYTTATPMIRMVTDGSIGISENEAAAFAVSVFPNPAVNEANVSFKLAAASDVTVTVTDLAGKTVYTNTLANAVAGAHTIEINTAAFADGVYTVNFNTNDAAVSKKLIVRN